MRSYNLYRKLGQFDYKIDELEGDLVEIFSRGPCEGYKSFYVGQTIPGTKIPNGIGIRLGNYGDIYEGHFKNGKTHGYGRYIYSNEDYYIGYCMYGYKQGDGEYHHNDGRVYRGDFIQNSKSGKGTMTYKDGKELTGWFDSGRFYKSG